MSSKRNFGKGKRFYKKFGDRNFKENKSSGPKIYKHKNQLSEQEVGITEFINNDLDGFSGIIKARFSDFQVNEIDLDGNIAKLTDTKIPPFENAQTTSSASTTDKEGNAEATESGLADLIPQETLDAIKSLVKTEEKSMVELDATDISKDDRTKIHQCLKKEFGRGVVCNTVSKGDKKMMQFLKFDCKDPETQDRKSWPKDKGEHVHFLVHKELMDTMEACLKIADACRIPPANLMYAGTKDKRAKTTQWFSVRRVEPWKLIVKTKSCRELKIGNVCFKDEPLKLGDLMGNKFRIALRNVTAEDQVIERSLAGLKENGFINYYGLQRFGNDKEVPTFSIGVNLLLGNWKEACDIILKPLESDEPTHDIAAAKKIYADTKDPKKALERFGKHKNKCVEFMLLSGLARSQHDNDLVTALESIPRSTRLLYIHSFQSLIWNMAVSHRIKEYGLKVIEGDLVFNNNSNENYNKSEEAEASDHHRKGEAKVETEEEKKEEEKEEGEGETSRAQEKHSDVIMSEEDPAAADVMILPDGIEKKQVKAITKDDLDKYTMYDVVLPLPGYDVIYPEHLKQFYKEALEKYGLTLEMPKQKVQTYSLSGTYRKVLGQAQDLTWKIMRYDEPNYNLIRSDFEEILGHEEPKSVADGKYKALVLEFTLASSSYATMVLREILKTDTSSSAHAKLNDYHHTPTTTTSSTNNGNAGSQQSPKILIMSSGSRASNDTDKDMGGVVGEGAAILNGDMELLSDAAKYEAFKNLISSSVDDVTDTVTTTIDDNNKSSGGCLGNESSKKRKHEEERQEDSRNGDDGCQEAEEGEKESASKIAKTEDC